MVDVVVVKNSVDQEDPGDECSYPDCKKYGGFTVKSFPLCSEHYNLYNFIMVVVKAVNKVDVSYMGVDWAK